MDTRNGVIYRQTLLTGEGNQPHAPMGGMACEGNVRAEANAWINASYVFNRRYADVGRVLRKAGGFQVSGF